jgi:hypothetical protein
VLGVLSGHVHDPFDILEDTPAGPVRMIGAGTLSQRLRSTPPSFNETRLGRRGADRARAQPRRGADADDADRRRARGRAAAARAGEPVAPVNQVPRTDPPVALSVAVALGFGGEQRLARRSVCTWSAPISR